MISIIAGAPSSSASYETVTVLPAMSTSASSTPPARPNAPSRADLQCPQWTSGTEKIVVVVISSTSFSARARFDLCLSAGASGDARTGASQNRAELDRVDKLGDRRVAPPGRDRLAEAGLEVVLENQPVGPLQRRLHGRYLLHDLDAVRLVLHHPDDSVQVAARGLDPVEDGSLVLLQHVHSSLDYPSPTPGGVPYDCLL